MLGFSKDVSRQVPAPPFSSATSVELLDLSVSAPQLDSVIRVAPTQGRMECVKCRVVTTVALGKCGR